MSDKSVEKTPSNELDVGRDVNYESTIGLTVDWSPDEEAKAKRK
jgi:hypothetical protein